MTGKTDTEPQVYVACLACYNEGRLHGRWIDADELEHEWGYRKHYGNAPPEDEDGRYPMTKCKKPNHDEWAIHDYDGVPNLGEHPDIPYLINVMRCIEEHGDAFREWFNLDPHNKSHHDDLSEAFQEAYCGKYKSEEDFAAEHAESMGYISPENQNPLLMYVDYELFWKASLRHSHYFSNGHVFRGDV